MKKSHKLLLYFFIFYGCISSILYFWGIAVGNADYSNLRERSPALYMASPMPLLFDRKDFFNTTSIIFTFTDKTVEILRLDRDFMSRLEGNSHRKLHFLRLFAFDKFYNSPQWEAAVKFITCKQDNPELNLKTKNKTISSVEIENIYPNTNDRVKTISIVKCP